MKSLVGLMFIWHCSEIVRGRLSGNNPFHPLRAVRLCDVAEGALLGAGHASAGVSDASLRIRPARLSTNRPSTGADWDPHL